MVDKHLIKNRYFSVDKSDSISHLIGQLKQHNERAALVFDKSKFLGIADTSLLIKTKLNPSKMKVAKIVKKVPVLTGDEDIQEISRLLFTSESRILPVMENKRVLGIIDSIDIIQGLVGTKHAQKSLSSLMTLKPITIDEDARIGKAINIMRENHISRLPIVDKKGDIINIASLAGLLFNFILIQQGRSEINGRSTQEGQTRAFKDHDDMNAYPVKNISSSIMITASPSDTLGRTIEKMERFNITSIVVTDSKKPVGIVSRRDLLKLFLKNLITY